MSILTSRRRTVGKNLPYDAEVEYIESNGMGYIDTGIVPKFNLSFDVTFKNPGPIDAEGYGNVFGARVSSNQHEYQLTLYNGGTVGLGYRNSIPMVTDTIYHVTWNGAATVTCNGQSYRILERPLSCPYTIILFGIHNGNKIEQLQKGFIYACKFGDLADYIPVRKDGLGYLYDKISGNLLGGTNFSFGPDK